MVFDHAPCFGDSTQVLTDEEIRPCSTVVAVVVSVVVLPDEEVDRPKPICRPPPYTHACRSPSLPPLQDEERTLLLVQWQGDDYFMLKQNCLVQVMTCNLQSLFCVS